MVTIRDARKDEYDDVATLLADGYVAEGHIATDSPYVHTLADTASRASAAQVLVAEVDGAVVGSITITPPGSDFAPLAKPDELEFRMLVVAAHARGAGVGSALVRRVVESARERGYRAVVISTMPSMVDARRLYERMGFVHRPERDWRVGPETVLGVLECAVDQPSTVATMPAR